MNLGYFWETEFFVINLKTGDAERHTGMFISGHDFRDALLNLKASGHDFMQLTGRRFNTHQEAVETAMREAAEDAEEWKEEQNERTLMLFNKLENMDYDSYVDLIEKKSKEDLEELIEELKKFPELAQKLKMTEGYYNRNYGEKKKKDDNTEEKGEEGSTGEETDI